MAFWNHTGLGTSLSRPILCLSHIGSRVRHKKTDMHVCQTDMYVYDISVKDFSSYFITIFLIFPKGKNTRNQA